MRLSKPKTINKSLLSKLVEENKLELKHEEDYYDFQTKDLENFLHLYFLEESKKLILDFDVNFFLNLALIVLCII